MKVAVITRHAITNYGSILQSIATQEVIEKLGHSCELIDYIRDDESCMKQEITILKRKPSWYNNFLKRTIYLASRQPGAFMAGKAFKKSRKKYLKLTDRYITNKELVESKPLADVYMTGSDQVWGPVQNGSYDSTYCLSFTSDNDKKISFAASFGHTEMTNKLTNYFKKWLPRYDHIAVREDSAVKILEKMEIDAEQVLDPTLLLTKCDWEQYMEPVREKKYILVYQLHNNKKLNEYAKKVAKMKKLPLIRISPTLHHISRGGKFIYLPSIGKFLSYINNAECMITDSFHGTAFAINLNTPFVGVLPNNNTGTRNMSILKLTGLTDRILKNENDIALATKAIDFSNANNVLAEKRMNAIGILKVMIEE